jgi:predicted SAM-dependent methyltransferase
MKLLRPIPQNRTYEQILKHYTAEKYLAEKLKQASRIERKRLFATMYDDLFKMVPDHPRLEQLPGQQKKINKSKMTLVSRFLAKDLVFVEFGSGDCSFSSEVSNYVKKVYAVDISDQRPKKNIQYPKNFEHIIFNGYHLDQIKPGSVDLVFSDQLIEHLHPDDVQSHLKTVYDILKPNGKYILHMPHLFTGPHDVSQYFSHIPQGFHLKEWTNEEFISVLKQMNFKKIYGIRKIRNNTITNIPCFYYFAVEFVVKNFPKKYRSKFALYLIPSVCLVAIK